MIRASVELTKPQKWLAWFALASGLFTILAATIFPAIFGAPLSPVAVAVFFLFGLGSLIAGYFGLAARPWAFWILFATYLVQLADYRSESFFFSFIGPLNLTFGWGWNDPPSQIRINILAIVVCLLASGSAVGLTSRPGESPPSPAEQ